MPVEMSNSCVCVCVCVCVYIYIYIYIYIIYIYIYMHTDIQDSCIHTKYPCMHTYIHRHAYVHTYSIHPSLHTGGNIEVHASECLCHTCMHASECLCHTCMHASTSIHPTHPSIPVEMSRFMRAMRLRVLSREIAKTARLESICRAISAVLSSRSWKREQCVCVCVCVRVCVPLTCVPNVFIMCF
jgi:hypothetical protein